MKAPGSLANKTAVVTGAAGAIGRAISERFLLEGARLAFFDVNPEALQQVGSALREDGLSDDRYLLVPVDVSDPAAVEAAFGVVDDALGLTEVVVANAGIARSASFLETTPEIWQRTLDINLSGVFYTCQSAARRMIKVGRGNIITMSSTNGLLAEKNLAAYNASKAGISLLTKTMAIELAPYGIRANALNPGIIDTGLAERAGLPADMLEAYRSKIPMGRPGRPEEVAAAALFLASRESSFITGLDLVIDGGQLSEE